MDIDLMYIQIYGHDMDIDMYIQMYIVIQFCLLYIACVFVWNSAIYNKKKYDIYKFKFVLFLGYKYSFLMYNCTQNMPRWFYILIKQTSTSVYH